MGMFSKNKHDIIYAADIYYITTKFDYTKMQLQLFAGLNPSSVSDFQ